MNLVKPDSQSFKNQIAFLKRASQYFDKLALSDEDSEFWANANNAINCLAIAHLLEDLPYQINGSEQWTNLLAQVDHVLLGIACNKPDITDSVKQLIHLINQLAIAQGVSNG